MTPPALGWQDDPKVDDVSLAADLKRLQSIRNGVFAHSNSTKVTNTDFEALWSDLTDIIERISQHGSSKHQGIRQRIEVLKQANPDSKDQGRMLDIFVK